MWFCTINLPIITTRDYRFGPYTKSLKGGQPYAVSGVRPPPDIGIRFR
jgi:hypothetical protein